MADIDTSVAPSVLEAPGLDLYRAPSRRTEREGTVRRVLTLALIASGLAYFGWRASETLDTGVVWLNWPLLWLELYLFASALLMAWVTWAEVRSAPFVLEDGHRVDVFITTYNEPDDIVRATVLGAMAMQYPHRTVILDDGRRASIRRLAEELGCDYLTRDNNTHAKAGNINNALGSSEADFIAIFDADHVPQPDFLTRTLGYFVDPRMAIVQTPQDYYNLTSIQHAEEMTVGVRDHWHEQRIFFDVIQPAKNRSNSAFWCGSCAVLRREAIISVGGMATHSVIEDLLTAQRMHAAGWKTYYDPTTLAYGIAPDDASQFQTQRLRWAQGAMQILRSRDNPLITPKLSMGQRLSYFSSLVTYFDASARFLLILLPVVVLLFALPPIEANPLVYLALFLPYLGANLGIAALNQGGLRNFYRQERFTLAKMLTSMQATLIVITGSRGLGFAVTPKVAEGGRTAGFYVIATLAGVSALASVVGVGGIAGLGPSAGVPGWMLAGSTFWAAVNCALLVSALPLMGGRTMRRQAYRFPWRIPVAYRVLRTGETHAGATVNLSWQGLSLIGSAERGDELNIVLKPHGAASIRLVGIVRSLDPSSSSIGCSLERSKRAALDQLVLAITTEGARMQDAAEAYQWAAVDRTIAHDRGG